MILPMREVAEIKVGTYSLCFTFVFLVSFSFFVSSAEMITIFFAQSIILRFISVIVYFFRWGRLPLC